MAFREKPAALSRRAGALQAFAERGGDAKDPEVASIVEKLGEHAPALLALALADPALPADLAADGLERVWSIAAMRARLGAEIGELEDGPEVRRALRRFRHRGIVRIALREISRLADVEQTAAELADLASATIDEALRAASAAEQARHGIARGADGEPIPLTILGMGKLGGRELNLGSDVDLCFFYETDEGQVEPNGPSVHELFDRIARRTVRALADATEDGFCFRVDLRLRPEGSRGPLVNSIASAERYYESWGRTWERAALLRARPIAGDVALGDRLLEQLRPFVFRRAVDPTIAVQMGQMLAQARRELAVDEERDVKLGRGGIREAEFFVQTLQLVWGGRYPQLQVPGTLDALRRLAAAGLVSDREAQSLSDGWALLRRVEHRIHAWTGYQTHSLPTGEERDRFARSLGFSGKAKLEGALSRARSRIAALFASLQPDSSAAPDDARYDALLDSIAQGADAETLAAQLGGTLPINDAYESAAHLVRLSRRANAPLGPVTRERLPELGRTLMREVGGAADPDSALRWLADFFTRLGGQWPYERLLLAEPRLTRRLIGLFGASGTLSSALVGHPEDVDLLLTHGAPGAAEIEREHAELPAEPEALVAELRRVKREVTLRSGLSYAAGEISVDEACERLSALAEAQVQACLRSAIAWATERWGEPGPSAEELPAAMVVCAMGKLGGRELGFGGDLDLVFFYGADGETQQHHVVHTELFARVAQRTMFLLRQPDAQGGGYETDARLRPSGSKGTLVVSVAAFDAYHRRTAAPWERQALVRARPIAGDPIVAAAMERRFAELAYEQGPTPPEELARTRARIETELAAENAARYHPKLGYGGLVDVEFLVQWLQMRHGDDRSVRTPTTLHALHALCIGGHLSERDADALGDAHTFFRTVEQSLRLLDEHRETYLEPLGRSGSHVARTLGLREQGGNTPGQALDEAYRRHALGVRALLERHVGALGLVPPWGRS